MFNPRLTRQRARDLLTTGCLLAGMLAGPPGSARAGGHEASRSDPAIPWDDAVAVDVNATDATATIDDATADSALSAIAKRLARPTCRTRLGGGSDCNANAIADECDIARGASTDTDRDGVPDECQPAVKYIRSYATHGAAGAFFINLNLAGDGPTACEPRAQGLAWLEVGFTQQMDPEVFENLAWPGALWLWRCNDLDAVYVPTIAELDASGMTATFAGFLLGGEWEPPADDERYQIFVNDDLVSADGYTLHGDRSAEVLVYARDVNGDGVRDGADEAEICAAYCPNACAEDHTCPVESAGVPADQSNARYDVMNFLPPFAGVIDANDVAMVGTGEATYADECGD